MSKTPFFAFSSTVDLNQALFEDWDFKNNQYYEACTGNNMIMSFPGRDLGGAHADKFILQGTTLQTFFWNLCSRCTKPAIELNSGTVLIKNTFFNR